MDIYTLELKEIPSEEGGVLKYREMLDGLLRLSMQGQAFDKKELKLRNRLRKNLKESNGVFKLSHDEAEQLKRIVGTAQWREARTEIEQFLDDVEAMPKSSVS